MKLKKLLLTVFCWASLWGMGVVPAEELETLLFDIRNGRVSPVETTSASGVDQPEAVVWGGSIRIAAWGEQGYKIDQEVQRRARRAVDGSGKGQADGSVALRPLGYGSGYESRLDCTGQPGEQSEDPDGPQHQ